MKKKVVVIGSGLAGSLVCNDLAGDVEVTLLELGEKDVIGYPPIEYLRKKLAEVKTFCFGGGGTTNLWHNGLIPINGEDVASGYFRNLLDEAKPYTDRAAANLFFPHESYSREYGDVVAEMNALGKDLNLFEDGVDCLLYPKKFKKLNVDSRVEAVYSVEEIDFQSTGGRITAVDYRVGSKNHQIHPDLVIVCAGTLGTPRLVGKVLSALGRESETVGKGLMDHPLGFVGKVKFKKGISESIRKFASLDKGNYESCTAARLKSDCGQYTCFAFFRPALTMANKLPIYKYKSLLGASSGADRIRNAFSPKIFHPDILAEIFSHVFGVNIRSRIFNVLVYFEQRRGDSLVTYDGSTLKVDWRITEKELTIYNNILEKLNTTLKPFSDEINIQAPLTEEWLWSGAHHSGTISLGDADDDLLDKDLKLKCCDNVYVCDGSVIQEHSYANTGLTIGQLALRLADKVR
jgi:GMC oxidoreductase